MEYVENPSYFQTIWAQIASVGWYIVGLVIILYYTLPHIQEKYKNCKFARNQQNNAAFFKKIDEIPQFSAHLEQSRKKMQESYNKNCALASIKEEEAKEKKRYKVLQLLENKNVGSKLGRASDDETPSTSTSLKSEYNPLMGDNTRRYRPQKRSCCKKGGCG